eukprot:1999672-Rhodomonas_salina.3
MRPRSTAHSTLSTASAHLLSDPRSTGHEDASGRQGGEGEEEEGEEGEEGGREVTLRTSAVATKFCHTHAHT